MARNLTPEEIAVFKHEFDQYDTDKGGNISIEEFGRVMSASGQKPTDEELAQIIKEVDLDGDGTINFNEFITMMTGLPYPPVAEAPAVTVAAPAEKSEVVLDGAEDLRKAWGEFDPSCKSSITTAQFRQVVAGLGESVSDVDIEEMMNDVDGEEKIDYKEFVAFMKKKDGDELDLISGYGA